MPTYELCKVERGSKVFEYKSDVTFDNCQWVQVDRAYRINGFNVPKGGYILLTDTCVCFSSGWSMNGDMLAVYIPHKDDYVGVWVDGLDLPLPLANKIWDDFIEEQEEMLDNA